MDLRITLQTIVNRALVHSRRQTDALGKLQLEASTGKRINLPEDDPLGAVAVLNARAQDKRFDADLTNIRTARSTLDIGVSTLQSANTLFVRARTLALEASNSTNDPGAFKGIATEVDALISQLYEIANTQSNGQYLFSGIATDVVPFTRDAAGNVIYQGENVRAETQVSASQTVATFYAGSEIFQPRQRGVSVYTGSQGAAPGQGVDSSTGQGTLVFAHTSTTIGLSQVTNTNSGIATGTNSATGDTILGPTGTHFLELVDTSGIGATGTISLNGGTPIAWTNADANLRVTGPKGEVVYVNTQNITSGFQSTTNGRIPLAADGTVASSGGTPVALTFGATQAVTDSLGGVTNVNTVGVRATGTTYVNYTGTFDAFQALTALRDDLKNVRGLTSREQIEAISARLSDLDRVRENILSTLGEQSANLQNLDGLESHAGDVQLETRKLVGDIESADLADVVIKMQAQENLFRLTLATSARLFDQTLLDFLQ